MTANEGLKEDRRGGSAPIVLELEPSETFVYRSTAMRAASDLRSAGSALLRDGTRAFGGEFRADPAVLARETQAVSRSEGGSERHRGVAVGGVDDIGARVGQAGNRQSRQRLPRGPQPQTLELVIGRFMPERRVGARAWSMTPPNAPDQAPATLVRRTTDFPWRCGRRPGVSAGTAAPPARKGGGWADFQNFVVFEMCQSRWEE